LYPTELVKTDYFRDVAKADDGRSLRVLADSRVADAAPDLASSLNGGPSNVEITVFDQFTPAPELAVLLRSLAPHVVVVDRVWLAISSMLMTLLRLGDDATPRTIPHTVLGVRPLEDMHKVEAAYHGFDDVIDLGQPPVDISRHLGRVADGRSSLDRDVLWTRVTRPVTPPVVLMAPQDELDRRIINLICIGLPDKEIAEVTHHSHQTIRNRISGLLQRSGLVNRTQMAWMHNGQTLAALMLQNLSRGNSTFPPS